MPPKSKIKTRLAKSPVKKPVKKAKSPKRASKKPVRKPKRASKKPVKKAKRASKKPVRKPKRASKTPVKKPVKKAKSPKRASKKPVRKPKRASKKPVKKAKSPKRASKKPVRKPKRASKTPVKKPVKKPKRASKTPVKKPVKKPKSPKKDHRKVTNKTEEYRPPENRDFMRVNSYRQYEKDIKDYKNKVIKFKNNKEVLKTLKWPDIHVYMTPREIERHKEALQEYNKNYRLMRHDVKVQFVLKVGLEPLEDIKVNKKEVNDQITKGLKDKKSTLWHIVTGSYSEFVDTIKEEYIGDKKVRITVLLDEANPKEYIQDKYGALAPDGWQEGDIILEDKYEVTLTLVSVKIVK
jgi:hypothetical protein